MARRAVTKPGKDSRFARIWALNPGAKAINKDFTGLKRRVCARKGKAMFHAPGPFGLILIAVVVLVLFGRGKIAGLMGEVGKGITSFKKGIKEGSEDLEKIDAANVVATDATKDKV